MRRVNKPFNLASGVQAAVDLRADLSSFQMKILRDGEMARCLKMGLTLQENPRLIPSTMLESSQLCISSASGDLSFSSGLPGDYTHVCPPTPEIHT